MKIVNLLPLSLSSTRHVGDIVNLKKRYYRAVSAYYLRPLKKARYRARFYFILRPIPISLSIVFNFSKNCLSVWSLILCLGVGNIPEEPWSI
jgi:hypothetical protein